MIQSYLRPVRAVRHLLWPLALPFMAITALRNLMFDLGLLRSRAYPVPVICIGNLEVGGSGKSPLVLHVAAHLLSIGKRVAVLSRGYGRNGSGFINVEIDSDAKDVGDEALQAKLRLPDITVAVCENRRTGIARLLLSAVPPDVIVMDDGFQHRWVRPSFSVIVTPSSLPYWHNFPMPVGTLRESRHNACRADALVITGHECVARPNNFRGPIFQVRQMAGLPVHFHGKRVDLKPEDKIILLSGVARPERFETSAKSVFEVLAHERHPDHHVFTRADMLRLRNVFHSFDPDIKAVLTTEKDAARIRQNPHLHCLDKIPIYVLPVKLDWPQDDEERFNQLIFSNAG
jgi:tetraacyldisaccharide 4'-kinase